MTKSQKNIEAECCCVKNGHKSSPRSEQKIKALQSRLSKIVGQVNGVKKMIDENRYCKDILVQLSACEKALQSVAFMVLEEHLETCVSEKIVAGDKEIIAETIDVFKKMV